MYVFKAKKTFQHTINKERLIFSLIIFLHILMNNLWLNERERETKQKKNIYTCTNNIAI